MRPTSPPRRRPPAAALAGLLPWLAVACTSAPTLDAPRRLDAPLTSGLRLFDEFLSPRRIGTDLHELTVTSGEMLAPELELRAPFTTGGELLAAEVGRLSPLSASARTLTGAEVARLATLRHSTAWSAVDVGPRLGMLRQDLRSLPATLQLDRRMLAEQDDFRHRTDPADDHPEAGFVPRLLRRILP